MRCRHNLLPTTISDGASKLIMRFNLKARINGTNDHAIQQALKQLGAEGEVKKIRGAFALSAEIEGTSAEELNESLLSALKTIRKRTKLRAEWISDDGSTQIFFDHLLIFENFK